MEPPLYGEALEVGIALEILKVKGLFYEME
jgi:hypothetical protein